MNGMEHFSQASAAAACSGLSRSAQSTAAKIQATTAAGAVRDIALQDELSFLSARLQQFRLHADQLGHCVADANVVHRQLGDTLISTLVECQNALGTVSARLEPGSGGLDSNALAHHEAFVAAHSRFFVLGTQLLTMWVTRQFPLEMFLVYADIRLEKLSKNSNGNWPTQLPRTY
jgi:hypothetical protein